MKKKIILCVAILSVSLAAAAFAAEAPLNVEDSSAARDPERVLAIVEGMEIKEKEVDQLLEALGAQAVMMYDNEPGRKMILEELVTGRLFALSARKQGLDETPEFVEAVDNFITQYLTRTVIENLIESVTVSGEDCKNFYDENPDEFTMPDQIRARHILIGDDETSADKLAFIQQELEKGVAFDVLAVEHSIEPAAQQSGGDLGFFTRGRMVPEFEEAAFALEEPGDISEPVKSSFGWHIIKLEEKQSSSVIPFDEVEPQIEQYLVNEKRSQIYQEELEALKQEYTVEILAD